LKDHEDRQMAPLEANGAEHDIARRKMLNLNLFAVKLPELKEKWLKLRSKLHSPIMDNFPSEALKKMKRVDKHWEYVFKYGPTDPLFQ
jgi:hypothetical protein